jgi:alpha-L-fucosidase 2
MILKAINKDGTVATDSIGIHINNSSEVTLYLSAATSFNGFDKCPDSNGIDEHAIAKTYLQDAIKKPHQAILSSHITDYKKYYDRVSFSLKDSVIQNDNISMPSDDRLLAYSGGRI